MNSYKLKTAIILPLKESFSFKNFGAVSIWVNDYLNQSKILKDMTKKVEHGELYAVGHLGDIISISLKEISKENARFMDFVISREEYSKHFSAYISQHLDTVGKEFNAYAQAKYRSYNILLC